MVENGNGNGNGKDIRSKIRKLFALSNSPNEHEAEAAMSKAQELLEQYNLSMTDIETADTTTQQIVDEILSGDIKRAPAWHGILFSYVAKAFDCYPYYVTKRSFGGKVKTWRLVGHKLDVETAASTYRYLVSAIEIASDIHLWRIKDEYSNVNAIAARNSFGRGFAEAVCHRVAERRAQRLSADCKVNALVVRRKEKVDDWVKSTLGPMGRGTSYKSQSSHYGSYMAGKKAGNEINLEPEVATRTHQKPQLA
jgi:hypothetical protein